MMTDFKTGDGVSWKYEGGRTSGTIISVRKAPFEVNGYTHHASPEEPQYEIRCSRTGHIAFHKASALTPE
ncbi:DUF2945 domain-containing protein [Acetobacter sp. LMG 1627]|uniref:DUF2945 domain-containing protein n=2 Tax=Acetobacter conturbans TaxID=1737472 RepID=A0ABX0JZV4_9PROT|nr:DUF2945 domain-containing protein [Acetobacter conturbans]